MYSVHTMYTLKQLREQAGYTQGEVAVKLGVCGRQLVSNWERGRSKPYNHTATLSALYGVTIEEIFNAIEHTNNDSDSARTCANGLSTFEEGRAV